MLLLTVPFGLLDTPLVLTGIDAAIDSDALGAQFRRQSAAEEVAEAPNHIGHVEMDD